MHCTARATSSAQIGGPGQRVSCAPINAPMSQMNRDRSAGTYQEDVGYAMGSAVSQVRPLFAIPVQPVDDLSYLLHNME